MWRKVYEYFLVLCFLLWMGELAAWGFIIWEVLKW